MENQENSQSNPGILTETAGEKFLRELKDLP